MRVRMFANSFIATEDPGNGVGVLLCREQREGENLSVLVSSVSL